MTALFRHWSRKNYTLGLSGHISVRDPEFPSLFWMNPLAIHFGLLKASDMLLLSDSDSSDDGGGGGGEVILAGNARGRPANKAGWAIHAAIHRRRGDVNAACHAHTENGVAWSAAAMTGDVTERKLSMINQDVCTLYGDALAVYGKYGGVVVGGALGEGEAIVEALGEKGKAAILLNHGLLSVGQTVDEAGFLFGLLDRSCGVELTVRKTGYWMNTIADQEAEFNFQMASKPVSRSCLEVAALNTEPPLNCMVTGNPSLGVPTRLRLRSRDEPRQFPRFGRGGSPDPVVKSVSRQMMQGG